MFGSLWNWARTSGSMAGCHSVVKNVVMFLQNCSGLSLMSVCYWWEKKSQAFTQHWLYLISTQLFPSSRDDFDYSALYVGQHQWVFRYCVCVGGQRICEWDTGRRREGEIKQVSDSHVLELGHVSPACCVRLSWCPLPILKLDNLGRQIGVTTIKLDTSPTHTHTHLHTKLHYTNLKWRSLFGKRRHVCIHMNR